MSRYRIKAVVKVVAEVNVDEPIEVVRDRASVMVRDGVVEAFGADADEDGNSQRTTFLMTVEEVQA